VKLAELAWNYISEVQEKVEIQKVYLFCIVVLGLLQYEDSEQTVNENENKNRSQSIIQSQLILPHFNLQKYSYDKKGIESLMTDILKETSNVENKEYIREMIEIFPNLV
jgi:hypothetical protein